MDPAESSSSRSSKSTARRRPPITPSTNNSATKPKRREKIDTIEAATPSTSCRPSTSSASTIVGIEERLAKSSVSDGERDEIVDMCKQIDEKLEDKAKAHNLTTVNVKSILHHLIKNPHVLSMIMGVGGEESAEVPSIKMTRAKAKANQKEGDIEKIPLRPVEMTNNFLANRTFEDDDDDEDYQPEADVEEQESDEGGSDVSDEEDDCDVTRTTLNTTDIFDDEDEDNERMNKTLNSQALPDKEDENKINEESGQHEQCNYALRSRRTGLVPNPEENIMDEFFDSWEPFSPGAALYTSVDDEYIDFVHGLQSTSLTGAAALADDDDPEDEEYNIFDEVEMLDELDQDDMERRKDRATEITRHEVMGLFTDLLGESSICEIPKILKDPILSPKKRIRKRRASDDYPSDKLPRNEATSNSTNPSPGAQSVTESASLISGAPIKFLPQELRQLRSQLEQHVQLLAQTVALCYHDMSKIHLCDKAQIGINKLDEKLVSSPLGEASMFNISNLLPAIATCHDIASIPTVKEDYVEWAGSGMELYFPRPEAVLALSRSAALLYPEIIPKWQPVPNNSRINKTIEMLESEEVLLCLGLLQFYRTFPSKRSTHIMTHMLPNYTSIQIGTHLKYRRQRLKREPDHIMSNLLIQAEKGMCRLEVSDNVSRLDGLLTMDQWPPELQPIWYKEFVKCFTVDEQSNIGITQNRFEEFPQVKYAQVFAGLKKPLNEPVKQTIRKSEEKRLEDKILKAVGINNKKIGRLSSDLPNRELPPDASSQNQGCSVYPSTSGSSENCLMDGRRSYNSASAPPTRWNYMDGFPDQEEFSGRASAPPQLGMNYWLSPNRSEYYCTANLEDSQLSGMQALVTAMEFEEWFENPQSAVPQPQSADHMLSSYTVPSNGPGTSFSTVPRTNSPDVYIDVTTVTPTDTRPSSPASDTTTVTPITTVPEEAIGARRVHERATTVTTASATTADNFGDDVPPVIVIAPSMSRLKFSRSGVTTTVIPLNTNSLILTPYYKTPVPSPMHLEDEDTVKQCEAEVQQGYIGSFMTPSRPPFPEDSKSGFDRSSGCEKKIKSEERTNLTKLGCSATEVMPEVEAPEVSLSFRNDDDRTHKKEVDKEIGEHSSPILSNKKLLVLEEMESERSRLRSNLPEHGEKALEEGEIDDDSNDALTTLRSPRRSPRKQPVPTTRILHPPPPSSASSTSSRRSLDSGRLEQIPRRTSQDPKRLSYDSRRPSDSHSRSHETENESINRYTKQHCVKLESSPPSSRSRDRARSRSPIGRRYEKRELVSDYNRQSRSTRRSSPRRSFQRESDCNERRKISPLYGRNREEKVESYNRREDQKNRRDTSVNERDLRNRRESRDNEKQENRTNRRDSRERVMSRRESREGELHKLVELQSTSKDYRGREEKKNEVSQNEETKKQIFERESRKDGTARDSTQRYAQLSAMNKRKKVLEELRRKKQKMDWLAKSVKQADAYLRSLQFTPTPEKTKESGNRRRTTENSKNEYKKDSENRRRTIDSLERSTKERRSTLKKDSEELERNDCHQKEYSEDRTKIITKSMENARHLEKIQHFDQTATCMPVEEVDARTPSERAEENQIRFRHAMEMMRKQRAEDSLSQSQDLCDEESEDKVKEAGDEEALDDEQQDTDDDEALDEEEEDADDDEALDDEKEDTDDDKSECADDDESDEQEIEEDEDEEDEEEEEEEQPQPIRQTMAMSALRRRYFAPRKEMPKTSCRDDSVSRDTSGPSSRMRSPEESNEASTSRPSTRSRSNLGQILIPRTPRCRTPDESSIFDIHQMLDQHGPTETSLTEIIDSNEGTLIPKTPRYCETQSHSLSSPPIDKSPATLKLELKKKLREMGKTAIRNLTHFQEFAPSAPEPQVLEEDEQEDEQEEEQEEEEEAEPEEEQELEEEEEADLYEEDESEEPEEMEVEDPEAVTTSLDAEPESSPRRRWPKDDDEEPSELYDMDTDEADDSFDLEASPGEIAKRGKRSRLDRERIGTDCLSDPVYRRRQELLMTKKIASDVKQRMFMHQETWKRIQMICAAEGTTYRKMDALKLLLMSQHPDVLMLLSVFVDDEYLPIEIQTHPLRHAYQGAMEIILNIEAYATKTRGKLASRQTFKMIASIAENLDEREFGLRLKDMLHNERILWEKIRKYIHTLEFEEEPDDESYEFIDLTRGSPDNEYNVHYEVIDDIEELLGPSSLPKRMLPVQVDGGHLYVNRSNGTRIPIKMISSDSLEKEPPKPIAWTKEEDFLILNTYNEVDGPDHEVINILDSKMSCRCRHEIQNRMNMLLRLLNESEA